MKKESKFMISGPKNPYGTNLSAQSANMLKKTLFWGSFCKFKGVPPISHRKDPEIRDQQPKKPVWYKSERSKCEYVKKKPLFRGSFCKFKGVPPISHRNDPEIRDQRPKKPIVDLIWWWFTFLFQPLL